MIACSCSWSACTEVNVDVLKLESHHGEWLNQPLQWVVGLSTHCSLLLQAPLGWTRIMALKVLRTRAQRDLENLLQAPGQGDVVALFQRGNLPNWATLPALNWGGRTFPNPFWIVNCKITDLLSCCCCLLFHRYPNPGEQQLWSGWRKPALAASRSRGRDRLVLAETSLSLCRS